ncbi:hypothetical protein PC129_g22877 [Phytophthora cactorum]|uniref:Uncharacterized protein n=1 Tax=Phytophthora cactorum TaxID=29920 RepID=A0A8T1ASX4_9STRA|nr:hypothetical protein PC115_g19793 [Phytophthora cactorum]KAG3059599.1 hypothetical protein PC122_g20256 [Phytophthora cactorum]KAG3203447.1 hypothetical protein PC129_g22877 [Phytophthora cactorum]
MVESKKRAALVTQMIRAWLWVSGLRRRLRAMILMTTTMEMAPVISAMLWMTLRQLRNASRLVQTMSATVRVSTVTCPTRRRQTLVNSHVTPREPSLSCDEDPRTRPKRREATTMVLSMDSDAVAELDATFESAMHVSVAEETQGPAEGDIRMSTQRLTRG